jgi:hypothetical protein
MNAPHPDWLANVKEIAVTPEQAEGRSETGAALAAIAAAMDVRGEPFAAGEVMGVVVERGADSAHAVMVSTGDSGADVERIAKAYGVQVSRVSLMSAAVMLQQAYQGLASCNEPF